MNLPDYTAIVKEPMDLSTIEKKLLNDEYDDPEAFESDMTLMFNNCYLYNPPTLPIYTMAKDLEKVFRNKWAQKPAEHRRVAQKRPSQSQSVGLQKRRSIDVDNDDDEDEDDEVDLVDDSDQKIAELERSIKNIVEEIQSIKSSKKSTTPTVAPVPKRRGRGPNKNPTKKRRVAKRSNSSDEDVANSEFTFEQKKRLSEMINNLTGDDLNTVVDIIQTSMPHLGDDEQGEIVLDIDALNKDTLRKLSDFVTHKSSAKNKKHRLHYIAKEKRIEQLEQTLEKFNQVKPNNYSKF
jgi:bromodomain-containing factor 1